MTAAPLDSEPHIDERELLQRHLPVLRFDPQFDYRSLAVESATSNPGNLLRRADGEVVSQAGTGWDPPLSLALLESYPSGLEPAETDHLAMAPDHAGDARRMQRRPDTADRIYGRIARDGARTWLQYWFWLYYNPKNLLGFGSHEGDWEMIQIGLDPSLEPEVVTYAQHTWAASKRWADIEHQPVAGGPRPVVYVAALSHASYFEPGTHPYIGGIDHAYGNGPEIADATLTSFGGWVGWPGRWGNVTRVLGGRFGNGPRSPAHQGQKWDQPTAFHNRARRRAGSRMLGRGLAWLGKRTFPGEPQIVARIAGTEVEVDYELPQALGRKTRYLYLTVHEGRRSNVIASRIVRRPDAGGLERILLKEEISDGIVMASAFNRFRQRSTVSAARADPV